MARQGIQGLIDQREVGDAAAQAVFQKLQIGGAKHVAAETAVEIGPLGPVVRRACAFGHSPNICEWPLAIRTRGDTEMNFIAPDLGAGYRVAGIEESQL